MTRHVAIAVFTLFAFAAPAFAADTCPVADPAAVTSAVKTEFSCEGAFHVLELCQLGSSADAALSDIVLSKCEPRFLPKATAATKAAYDKARGKCSKIAAKDGTMYQGQAAVCMARTGRDFARKYGTRS